MRPLCRKLIFNLRLAVSGDGITWHVLPDLIDCERLTWPPTDGASQRSQFSASCLHRPHSAAQQLIHGAHRHRELLHFEAADFHGFGFTGFVSRLDIVLGESRGRSTISFDVDIADAKRSPNQLGPVVAAEAVSGFVSLDVSDLAASRFDYDVRDVDTTTLTVKDASDCGADAEWLAVLQERARSITTVTDDSGIHLQGNWPAVTAISFVLINRSPFIRRVGDDIAIELTDAQALYRVRAEQNGVVYAELVGAS